MSYIRDGLTRRGLLCGAGGLAVSAAASGLDFGSVNVRGKPYRAAADGRTDDTQAIQRAMDDTRKRGGGIVFLPAGEYYVAGHLVVPGGVTLMGIARAPQTWTRGGGGSVLLAVEGAGKSDGTPFLTLDGNNATIEGLSVFYPNQVLAEEPLAYPWTVASGKQADNVAIVNCLLVNPYQGVDFATNSAHRHFISGLYGQPLLKGLWVDRCYDIGRVKNVHLWPFWTQDKRIVDFTTTRGTTFIFQRTDWEVVEDVFCWGYNVGVEFSSSEPRDHPGLKGIHGMNGQMTNVNFDNVNIGIDISGTQPYAVHIANLNVANAGAGDDHIGIWGRNSAKSAELSVRGASFWGYINQVLRWEIPGTVTLADSRVVEWNHRLSAVELLAGKAMIHDISFANPKQRAGTAVRIGADVERAMVCNNQLNGHVIVNEGGDRAALLNNQA